MDNYFATCWDCQKNWVNEPTTCADGVQQLIIVSSSRKREECRPGCSFPCKHKTRNSSWVRITIGAIALLSTPRQNRNCFVADAFSCSRNRRMTVQNQYFDNFARSPRISTTLGFNAKTGNKDGIQHFTRNRRQRPRPWSLTALHFENDGGQTNDELSEVDSSLGDIIPCPNGDLLSSECNPPEAGEENVDDVVLSLYEGIVTNEDNLRNNLSIDKPTTYPIPSPDTDDASGGTLGDIMSYPKTEDVRYKGFGAVPFSNGIDNELQREGFKQDADSSLRQNKKREEIPTSGLVTAAGGTLTSHFGHKMGGHLSPLERIALTANGNLQRIFSSYYDAPVHVHVDFCRKRQKRGLHQERRKMNDKRQRIHEGKRNGERVNASIFHEQEWFCSKDEDSSEKEDENATVWDRRVLLIVHSKVFCTASSTVTVRDPDCLALVESGKVGIGQLFRHLNILPTFELIDAGRITETQQLWREYVLSCDEVTCCITEIFEADAWSIEPPHASTNFPLKKLSAYCICAVHE